jgi:hypothetical protein
MRSAGRPVDKPIAPATPHNYLPGEGQGPVGQPFVMDHGRHSNWTPAPAGER